MKRSMEGLHRAARAGGFRGVAIALELEACAIVFAVPVAFLVEGQAKFQGNSGASQFFYWLIISIGGCPEASLKSIDARRASL